MKCISGGTRPPALMLGMERHNCPLGGTVVKAAIQRPTGPVNESKTSAQYSPVARLSHLVSLYRLSRKLYRYIQCQIRWESVHSGTL